MEYKKKTRTPTDRTSSSWRSFSYKKRKEKQRKQTSRKARASMCILKNEHNTKTIEVTTHLPSKKLQLIVHRNAQCKKAVVKPHNVFDSF